MARALLLAAILAAPACVAEDPRARNVLLVVVDDLNTQLGTYGLAAVRSPSIDALAARGVRFDRAYAQYALCHPSRTSLLSGRYPETTGVLDNETHPRARLGAVPFLPEHFRHHGYVTQRFGKVVHNRFQSSIAWGGALASSVSPPVGDGPPPLASPPPLAATARGRSGARSQPSAERRAVGWQPASGGDADLLDGRIARRAVAWLERNHEEPFFLAVGFNKPHPPFVAPREYFDLYPPQQVVLAPEPAPDPGSLPSSARKWARIDGAMSDPQRRHAIAAYRACVSFVDAQIGLLIEALDRLDLWEETVVVLVSDHGMHLGEHGGIWRKMTLFEEATRVPLVVVAPGSEAGGQVSAPVELVDLFPTLTALSGLPAPDGLQGQSLEPLLRHPGGERRRGAYSVLGGDPERLGRSIRTSRYGIILWPDGSGELYDHRVDPRELRNLWNDPDHRDERARLLRALEEARRRAGEGAD